jgi:hypothetical protein
MKDSVWEGFSRTGPDPNTVPGTRHLGTEYHSESQQPHIILPKSLSSCVILVFTCGITHMAQCLGLTQQIPSQAALQGFATTQHRLPIVIHSSLWK